MNEVTIKGKVTNVDEVREYGAKGFKKHLVVVETGDKWSAPIAIDFVKELIQESSKLKVDDVVIVEAEVRSRAWNDKWFTSVTGKSIVRQAQAPAEDLVSDVDDELDEDVPF